MFEQFYGLVVREVLTGWRQQNDIIISSVFFVLAGTIFAITTGGDHQGLAKVSGGIIWVLFVLTGFLPIDRLWKEDLEDGTLDQMLSLSVPGWQLAVAKSLRHMMIMLPTVFLAVPCAAILLQFPLAQLGRLTLGFLVALPSFSLLTVMGAAFTLKAKGQQLVIAIILLPLMLPVLIFGAELSQPIFEASSSILVNISALTALFLFFLILCPWMTGLVLRYG